MDDLLYISRLIRKSWSDELTEGERKHLNAWINRSEANRDLFEKAAEGLEDELRRLEAYDIAQATERIFARANLQQSGDAAFESSQTSRNKRRWMMAASAILVVSLTLWLVLSERGENTRLTKQDSLPAKQNIKIVPGGNNAVLTLSDGTRIILDSADNGPISQQGGSDIIKLESGKLAYTSGASGNGNARPIYNTVSTPRGGQYQVILPDGSMVWLNAASSVSFPAEFENNTRLVTVTGEVYFDVKPLINSKTKEKIPLVVKVASSSGVVVGEVKVLGTQFNINAYDDEGAIQTTLLEGEVQCIDAHGSAMLKPGQQATYTGTGIQVKKEVNTDRIVAWKNGHFIFESESIENIMRQISRWYDIEVSYKGAISREVFSGIVSRAANLEQVLTIMETGGVKFKIEGREIMVMQ